MAAVTLLVPNNMSGIQARRHLARQPAPRGSQGVAGVFVATAIRLAEQLAAPILASRRPATTPVVAAAWRAALDHAPGVFETVKDHPATIRALVSAHRELRDLTEPALTAVANASALAADLVRLHRDVTTALRPGWYDQRDIADAATQRLSGPTDVTAELGTVVLY